MGTHAQRTREAGEATAPAASSRPTALTPEGAERLAAKIAAYADLEPNWEGYGGEVPGPRALENAASFLRTLAAMGGVEPPRVAPRGDAAVGVSWRGRDGGSLAISFTSEGRVEWYGEAPGMPLDLEDDDVEFRPGDPVPPRLLRWVEAVARALAAGAGEAPPRGGRRGRRARGGDPAPGPRRRGRPARDGAGLVRDPGRRLAGDRRGRLHIQARGARRGAERLRASRRPRRPRGDSRREQVGRLRRGEGRRPAGCRLRCPARPRARPGEPREGGRARGRGDRPGRAVEDEAEEEGRGGSVEDLPPAPRRGAGEAAPRASAPPRLRPGAARGFPPFVPGRLPPEGRPPGGLRRRRGGARLIARGRLPAAGRGAR